MMSLSDAVGQLRRVTMNAEGGISMAKGKGAPKREAKKPKKDKKK